MSVKLFKESGELGLTAEDVQVLLTEALQARFNRMDLSSADFKVEGISLHPQRKYCVRLTLKND